MKEEHFDKQEDRDIVTGRKIRKIQTLNKRNVTPYEMDMLMNYEEEEEL